MSTGYKEYLTLARSLGLEAELIQCTNRVAILRHGRLYEIDGSKPWQAIASGVLSPWSKILLLRPCGTCLPLSPA